MTRIEIKNERRPERFDTPLAEVVQSLHVVEPVDHRDREVIAGSPETLCGLCVQHGRRPSMRRQVNRKWLDAGESSFAKFNGDATMGESGEANLVAATMVHPDFASVSASLVSEFGLAFEPGRSGPSIRIPDAYTQRATKRRTARK